MATSVCCLYTIPEPPSHYWVGGYWRNYKQCDELSDNQDQSLSHNISHHLCTGLVSSYQPTEGLVIFSLIPHLSSIFWHPSFHLQSLHYYHNNLVNIPSVLELSIDVAISGGSVSKTIKDNDGTIIQSSWLSQHISC